MRLGISSDWQTLWHNGRGMTRLKRLWDRWSSHPMGGAALGLLFAAAIIGTVAFLKACAQ